MRVLALAVLGVFLLPTPAAAQYLEDEIDQILKERRLERRLDELERQAKDQELRLREQEDQAIFEYDNPSPWLIEPLERDPYGYGYQ